ncbi:hypothetical protein NDU88_000985 [Pleurodeles waltl]|uniref:Uncharacterized protein n=1 Tax=Pleurodeles waltl TaxID=8319 RepID=A0AAV7SB88_PLEWA|nr:hypothetical protein NDU88_000985 [Pleurodeles waltl]
MGSTGATRRPLLPERIMRSQARKNLSCVHGRSRWQKEDCSAQAALPLRLLTGFGRQSRKDRYHGTRRRTKSSKKGT